jgi:iron(III) transport system ATP-binding protein
MSVIELSAVAKRFGDTQVLEGVDLTVPETSLTAVLGASGSGKTTLLRLIAGFDRIDSGRIAIGGKVLDDGRRSVKTQHRGVGYVPQDGALFPHLTVIGNIGFGLARAQGTPAQTPLARGSLSGLARRYPHQLSGGQQQRVSLARALAIRPSVVLLDEPFSSLDASLRASLGRDVARILREASTTAILVTHDQDEALALADQVAVLDDGEMVASSDPRTLYRDPPDLSAATAIGEANLIAARIEGRHAYCALGRVAVVEHERTVKHGVSRLLLRPEQLKIDLDGDFQATKATVVEFHYHGHDALVRLRLEPPGQEMLLARVSGEVVLQAGQKVGITVQGYGRAWPIDCPASEQR